MADPSNIHAIDDLKFLTGFNIEPVVASRGRDRRGASTRYYEKQASTYDEVIGDFDDDDVDFGGDGDDDVNVVDLEKAVGRGAGRQAVQRDPAQRDQEGRVATSTSSPTRRASACATASTACSTRRCRRRSS